ncbi:His Kinase A (phospho-acceptor) domain-containing protein [Allopseudospirillum japonicum]|uniref:histidine kinase n=1 Tax=Allopseudospirillum japonicum TaxID=64971 RepID=A0A1H6S7G6_9GAMM|nr:7TM-DISM domain-containing protein [Allopseudospirillum japonicum]SEI59372.1 His Kinase A (phospho-acceptor) domain-containing protein [Allopseudospirillum japonicum]
MHKSSDRFIIFILFFLYSSSIQASADFNDITSKVTNLDTIFYYKEDAKEPLSAADAYQLWQQGSFKQSEVKPKISLGFHRPPIWIALPLNPKQDLQQPWETYYLEIGEPFLRHLTIYQLTSPNSLEKLKQGEFIAYQQNYKHPNPLIKVRFNPKYQSLFLIRVHTESAFLFLARLYTENTLKKISIIENFSLGIYAGIIFIASIISLIFWLVLYPRQHLFIYYSIYLISSLLVTLFLKGWLPYFLDNPNLSLHLGRLSILVAVIASSQTIAHFYHLPEKYPTFYKLYIKSLLIISFSLTPLIISDFFLAGNLSNTFVLTSTLIDLAIILFFIFKQKEIRSFFLLASFTSINAYGYLQVLSIMNIIQVPEILLGYFYQSLHLPSLFLHIIFSALAIYIYLRKIQSSRIEQSKQYLNNEIYAKQEAHKIIHQRQASLNQEIQQSIRIRQQLQEALQNEKETRQQQRNFIAMLSHEIRSPLASLQFGLQGLQRKTPQHQANIQNLVSYIDSIEKAVDTFTFNDRLQNLKEHIQFPIDEKEFHTRLYTLKSVYPQTQIAYQLDSQTQPIYGDMGLLVEALAISLQYLHEAYACQSFYLYQHITDQNHQLGITSVSSKKNPPFSLSTCLDKVLLIVQAHQGRLQKTTLPCPQGQQINIHFSLPIHPDFQPSELSLDVLPKS